MDDLTRIPRLTDAGRAAIRRLREHPDAPAWNYAVGDRLLPGDDDALALQGDRLRGPRWAGEGPPDGVLASLSARIPVTPWLRERVPAGALDRVWTQIPTTRRADLATSAWRFVPEDQPLDRLIIYRTAGTTGHPVEVPHHPVAVAAYLPLVEAALTRYGVAWEPPDARGTAAVLVGSQLRTYTYATALSAWGEAGFAKVNLRPTEWRDGGAARRWLLDAAPPLINGEPVAFARLAEVAPDLRPRAMISTSSALSDTARAGLSAVFGCPVIDWYAAVEVGPVAVGCPLGQGWHLLAPDVYVEIVGEDDQPVRDGVLGTVVVSGGRNPYLPLLRYRTGDAAAMRSGVCACGDPGPTLLDLVGRSAVTFHAADGTPVGPVDVSRRLRELPLLIHTLRQAEDGALTLTVRDLPGQVVGDEALRTALVELFGALTITIRHDPTLGDGDRKLSVWERA